MTQPTPSHSTTDANASGFTSADLGTLFDAHATALLRVVERLSGSGGHVEEIVQDVFLVAHRQLDAVAAAKSPRAWLYAVAINLARAHRRQAGRRNGLWARFGRSLVVDTDAETRVVRGEEGAMVRRCIDQLPERAREVVVLYELEGLEGAAIAGLLGIPLNTVWTRLRTGRAKLVRLFVARGLRPGGDV